MYELYKRCTPHVQELYKLYFRCISYICVVKIIHVLNRSEIYLYKYIYIYTRPSSTNHGRYLLVVIGVEIG